MPFPNLCFSKPVNMCRGISNFSIALLYSAALMAVLLPDLFRPVLAQQAEIQPGEAEELFERAWTHYLQAEEEEAIELFQLLTRHYEEYQNWEKMIESIIMKAMSGQRLGEMDRVEERVERAEMLARDYLESGHQIWSRVYNVRAYLAIDQNDLDEALEWAERSLELIYRFEGLEDRKVRTHSVHGYILDARGQYPEAIETYTHGKELARQIDDDREQSFAMTLILNNLGVTYRKYGEPEEAARYYRMNREYLEKLYHSNHPEVAMNYNNMGGVYYNLGDIEQAAQYFLQSARILETNYGRGHRNVAIAYNNAGSSYAVLGRLDEAIRYLEEALDVTVNLLGGEHPDVAFRLANLAGIYQQRGELDTALEYLDRSISIRETYYGDDHPSLASSYIRRGELHMVMDEPTRALRDFEEVIRIGRDRLGFNHPEVAEALVKQGDLYRGKKRFGQAFEMYQEAIVRLANSFESRNIEDNPAVLESSHPISLLKALEAKASLLTEYFLVNRNREYLETSYHTYELAMELIDDLQLRFQHEASKLNLLGEHYSVYEGAMEAIYNLWRVSGDPSYLNSAFAIAEKSRARIAVELLRELEAREIAGISEEMLEHEQVLNEQIAAIHQQLAMEREKENEERDPSRISALQDSLFVVHQKQQDWMQIVEEEYPDYYEIKYHRGLISADEVRELLTDEEAVISYLMGEENVYATVLSSRDLTLHKLGPSGDVPQKVEELLTAIDERNSVEYRRHARSLYQNLVEPLDERLTGVEKVKVAPDQLLHHLPFELLLSAEPEDAYAHEWGYWIRDVSISYIPSMSIYRKMREQTASPDDRMLAVAPFADDGSVVDGPAELRSYTEEVTPLPVSRFETEQITELYRTERRFWNPFAQPRQADIWLNRQATIPNLLAHDLAQYRWIHFATHAFVNESSPELSGIVLAADLPGPSEEGGGQNVLFQRDILNLNLNAELVVLSACETGVGRIARGEGLIGFTRSFIYSGAGNLVVSLWKVGDRETSDLMIRFYEELLSGKGKSEALRSAKLSMIEQPEYAFPTNWAAFILFGS